MVAGFLLFGFTVYAFRVQLNPTRNKQQMAKQPANPMIAKRFSKAFIKELREDIRDGAQSKHIKEGCSNVVFKDTRDNGARLKLRLSKSGVASFFIIERFLNSDAPNTVNIAGIDADLDAVTERAKEMQNNIVKGLHPEHGEGLTTELEKQFHPSIRQLHEERLAHMKNRKPRTRKDWIYYFDKLGDWQDIQINELTPKAILLKHLRLEKKHKGYMADNIIKYVITLINSAMKNPEPNYNRPDRNIVSETMRYNDAFFINHGQSRRASRAFPEDKWASIWEAINDLREKQALRNVPTLSRTAHYYFKFLMLTGMRDGTVKTIEWHQIDLAKGTISWVNAEDVEKKKIDQKVFDLPVCDYIWDMLKQMRAEIVDETGKEPEGYLFKSAGRGKSPYVETGMPDQWQAIREKVGGVVATMRANDFRSTFISVADLLAMDRHAVKALIDHKENKRDAYDGYIDRKDPVKRQHVNRIAGYILETIGEQTKPKESTILPEYIMKLAQNTALKEDKEPEEVLARWARMGSQLDKLQTDDPEILMIKNG
jgi:integrase